MNDNPESRANEGETAWRRPDTSSHLGQIVEAVLAVWPEHEEFLRRSLQSRSAELMDTTEKMARLVQTIVAPEFETHARAYKWTCAALNKEVFHFIRHKRYRYSRFAEVQEQVYGNPEYMTPYVRGLLLSQILWMNHSQVVNFYLNRFVSALPGEGRLLEVGPGHGLFCAFAAEARPACRIDAWDVSPSSLEVTRESLSKLGMEGRVTLKIRNVMETTPDTGSDRFDGIVISEVLEHLEDPVAVLRNLSRYLTPKGKIFINVPVNSPSPDHIFLLRTPEEARALAEKGGFRVFDFEAYPVTGYTEEEARIASLTISCAMVATLTPSFE